MSEVTRAAAVNTAEEIRTETGANENTPQQVGQHIRNHVDSTMWNNKGLAAARPASSTVVGDRYFATDTGVLSIWNGSTWVQYSTPPVSSVHSRTGAVVAAASDYNASQIDNDSGVAGAFVDDALDALAADIAAVSGDIPAAGGAPADVTKATAAAGVAATFSRSDHKHNITTAAPAAGAVAVGNAAAEGSATTLARSDHTHTVSAGTPVNVTKAANAAGSATTFARSDHKHDVTTAAAVALTDAANAEGSATSLARSDHTHSHGARGGGTLHAVATGATAGFMSSADKTKLDGLSGGGDADAIHDNVAGEIAAVTLKGSPVGADLLLIEDSAAANVKKSVTLASAVQAVAPAAGGAPVDVTKAAAAAGVADTFSRSDHKHDVSTATAVALTDTTSAEGAATSLARSDHTHAHGDRAGGTLHAVATTSVAGFMSGADKTKLDGLSGSDSDAIHDNVAGEIAAITVKASPIGADLLLIEDSAAANVKKRATITSVVQAIAPAAGGAPVDVTKATAAAGVAATFSRSDHKHNITTAAPAAGAVAVGNAAAEGGASTLARSDHTHTVSAGTPVNVTKAANAAGTANTFARSDHKHDVTTATAVALTDSANAEGSATSLARSDHTHAHGDRAGGTLHAVATISVAGFMSGADKTKLDAIPAGASGNVQYNNGSGGLAAEAAFTYDSSANRLTADVVRAASKHETYESAAGSNEKLWDENASADVHQERTRTDADGAGNTYREIERQGLLVSRAQYSTQYGVAEVVDSYSVEVDTADLPAAASLYRNKAGTALTLSAGFSYVFEVDVQTHIAGVGYEKVFYVVTAHRPAAGNVALVEVVSNGAGADSGLDMQFAANTGTQQITCQPTVGVETAHRKVRWSVRMVRRTTIVTVDT